MLILCTYLTLFCPSGVPHVPHVYERVTIIFCIAFDWLGKWCEFLNQSQKVVKESQSNSGLFSAINQKLL